MDTNKFKVGDKVYWNEPFKVYGTVTGVRPENTKYVVYATFPEHGNGEESFTKEGFYSPGMSMTFIRVITPLEELL